MHSVLLFLSIPVHKGFTRLGAILLNFGTQLGFSCKVVIASWIAMKQIKIQFKTRNEYAEVISGYKLENDSVKISINPETAHMI